MNKYIVGLDIGTTKIACFIGERVQNGKIRIVGFGKTESIGVERGIVKSILHTSESIARAVAAASEMAKYQVTEVYVGIAGQHIKSRSNQGSIMIPDDHRQIKQSDVDRLLEDQTRIMLDPGEEIIHVFSQDYIVDNEKLNVDIDPVGVAGKCLTGNFLIVTGNVVNIRNLRDAVTDAGLSIKGMVLEPVASAYAVLDDDDRSAGVALVDIGGGTTDIAIFQDSIIRHTHVIPIAGNVITNDIRDNCRILKHQAESLKTKFGSCLPSAVNQDDVISIPGLRTQSPREISVKTLAGIIRSRMILILEQVGFEIQASGFERQLIAGIALTGGGAQLKNIKELTELNIGIDARIGNPAEQLDQQGSPALEDFSQPMYATGIGLVIYGILESERQQQYDTQNKNIQPNPEPEPTNQQEPEPEAEPAQRKSKSNKTNKPGTRNLTKTIEDWLAKHLNDDSLDE